jgi:Leucine-rich repeat (LRR) protein
MITEALIIRKSGEYDCEVVTKLKIDKMGMLRLFSLSFVLIGTGIQRMTNLENCIALIDLDLSFNEASRSSNLLYNLDRYSDQPIEWNRTFDFIEKAQSFSQQDPKDRSIRLSSFRSFLSVFLCLSDNVQDLICLESFDLRANLIGQIDDVNNLREVC